MSTHYIEEAERLADDVAVMTAGRVIARGKPAALIKEHAGARRLRSTAAAARAHRVRRHRSPAGISVRAAGPAIAVLAAEDAPRELIPDHAVDRAASLEDVFVKLTGEDAE